MSAFARGAAGFLTHRDRRRRMAKAAVAPIDAMEQAERHLRRFVSPERARELAAEAVEKVPTVSYKRRRSPA
jgi:hypothetical protein